MNKKGKENNLGLILVIGIVVFALIASNINLGLFSASGFAMDRNIPSIAQTGSQFSIVYSTTATGKWGASIEDSVSGGCKFPDGSSTLKTVMLSTEGATKTIQITAPSSQGSCTFHGDYKFGTEAIKNFQDRTITISVADGNGVCPAIVGYKIQNGQCVYTTDGCEVIYTTLEQCKAALINGNGVPSFDLNKVLFKIGDFEVTLLIMLVFVGLLFLVLILTKRR